MTVHVLEPDLAICDAHFHVMDHSGLHYRPDNYFADATSGHRIVRAVFVESDDRFYRRAGPPHLRPVGEIDMAADLRPPREMEIAGIVGFIDLTQAHLTNQALDAATAAGRGKLRGIRHRLPQRWNTTIDGGGRNAAQLYADPAFRTGAAEVAKHGLVLDTWQYFHQLPWLTDLARAVPETRIVVNHVGGIVGLGPYSGRRDESFHIWQANMAQAATCPNVHIKLGGLGMETAGFNLYADDPSTTPQTLADAWRPYIQTCIEIFGPQRCMFESNFPADAPSCHYPDLWNAFKLITRQASAAEKALLYHDTATRVYNLEADSPTSTRHR